MLVFAGSIDIYIGKTTAIAKQSTEPMFETELRDSIVAEINKNRIKVPVHGKIASYLSTADFYVTRDENNGLTVQLNKA